MTKRNQPLQVETPSGMKAVCFCTLKCRIAWGSLYPHIKVHGTHPLEYVTPARQEAMAVAKLNLPSPSSIGPIYHPTAEKSSTQNTDSSKSKQIVSRKTGPVAAAASSQPSAGKKGKVTCGKMRQVFIFRVYESWTQCVHTGQLDSAILQNLVSKILGTLQYPALCMLSIWTFTCLGLQ